MIYRTSVFLILAAGLMGMRMAQDDGKAEEILARAGRAYKAAATLKSEFVQKIEIRALETEKEGRGVVYQKKPNYFKMQFAEPEGDIVVADGEWFWMYYPSAQPDQIIRTAIDQTAEGQSLGGQFLVNPSERYVATYVQVDKVGDRSTHLLSLVPKFDAPYTLVRVWIDTQDFLVRRTQIYEENETIRTVSFFNLESNVDLPDELFRFSPPEGVEVFTR